MIFEVRGLPKSKQAQGEGWSKNMDVFKGASIGVIVECEGGYVSIPTYDSAKAYDREGKLVKEWREGADHYANFVAAVRSVRRAGTAARRGIGATSTPPAARATSSA